jgi:hypothetical protein
MAAPPLPGKPSGHNRGRPERRYNTAIEPHYKEADIACKEVCEIFLMTRRAAACPVFTPGFHVGQKMRSVEIFLYINVFYGYISFIEHREKHAEIFTSEVFSENREMET